MSASLYLDDDVHPQLARLLRSHGIDVVSPDEIGTAGQPDEQHLQLAAAQGRALLSYNFQDFTPLAETWFNASRDHAGIILSFRQFSRAQLGEGVRLVLRLLAAVPKDELRNTVRFLDEFRD